MCTIIDACTNGRARGPSTGSRTIGKGGVTAVGLEGTTTEPAWGMAGEVVEHGTSPKAELAAEGERGETERERAVFPVTNTTQFPFSIK